MRGNYEYAYTSSTCFMYNAACYREAHNRLIIRMHKLRSFLQLHGEGIPVVFGTEVVAYVAQHEEILEDEDSDCVSNTPAE